MLGSEHDLMPKKLIIITGSPCVGKTTVADVLFQSYENSAFFDSDWAWCVNPFSLSDPRFHNGDKTTSFALSNYLASGFDYVILASAVVIGYGAREAILRDITSNDYVTVAFTLKCSEKTLAERHQKREGDTEVIYDWLRMEPHDGDYVINTDGKTPKEIAAEMKEIIDGIEG